MAEQRRAPRRRVYFGARIAFDENATLDCIVRDMSEDGARLAANCAGVGLPDRFSLFIAKQRATYDAALAWQREDDMGVRLLARHDHANVLFFDAMRRRGR